MFMTHLQNGVHMCEVDSAVEHIPRNWGKAAEKQEWCVGCPWMSFLFWKPTTPGEGPTAHECLWDISCSKNWALLSLVRSPHNRRKAQVLYAWIFFLLLPGFQLQDKFNPASLKPPKGVIYNSGFPNVVCGPLGFLGPFQEICKVKLFSNNSKTIFTLFTNIPTQVTIVFSRGYVACEDVITQTANKMCAYTLFHFLAYTKLIG